MSTSAFALSQRNALIEAHLGIVRPLALAVRRSLPQVFELEDLIGAGYLGLVRAADRYAPADHAGLRSRRTPGP